MSWFWNEAAKRYQWRNGSARFLSHETVMGYVTESLATAGSAMDLLAEYVAEGLLSVGDWRMLVRQELKKEYIRQYLLGRGGLGQMAYADWGSIGGMLKEQYRWLDGFLDEVAAGRLSEAQIRSRLRMYVNSARQAFERARTRAIMGWEVHLPAYPGDGSTACLSNCGCEWRIEVAEDENGVQIGWDCFWELNPALEHCQDCTERHEQWWPYEVRF